MPILTTTYDSVSLSQFKSDFLKILSPVRCQGVVSERSKFTHSPKAGGSIDEEAIVAKAELVMSCGESHARIFPHYYIGSAVAIAMSKAGFL